MDGSSSSSLRIIVLVLALRYTFSITDAFKNEKKRYSKSVGASLKMHFIIKCSGFMCFTSHVPLLILGTHQRLHQYDLNVSMVSLDTDVHCVVRPVISLVGCFCPSDPEDNGHK